MLELQRVAFNARVSGVDLNPARNPGESFAMYKARRLYNKAAVAELLKGQMMHETHRIESYVDEGGFTRRRAVKTGGTYRGDA